MKIASLFLFFTLAGFCQENLTDSLKSKFDAEKYADIIYEHSGRIYTYPAKAVFYVGMAYYMSGDDMNTIRCMSISIAKDSTDSESHYIKGMSLNFFQQYGIAIPDFQRAIALNPHKSKYFCGLGDAYWELREYQKALDSFLEATKKENPIDWSYKKLPEIYAAMNQPDKALEATYLAKSKIGKESASYTNMLYNIGLYENLNGNYDKAETALLELLQINPSDYEAISKLIQSYYGKKEYDNAQSYRKKLYTAKRNSLLEGNIEKMFCFDQFQWKGQQISAFERYEEGSNVLYYKHIFYVLKANGEIDYQIQTEYSPISIEMGGPKYFLGMEKDGTHTTLKAGFDDGFLYDDLKKAVIKVVEEKMEEAASSRMGN